MWHFARLGLEDWSSLEVLLRTFNAIEEVLDMSR